VTTDFFYFRGVVQAGRGRLQWTASYRGPAPRGPPPSPKAPGCAALLCSHRPQDRIIGHRIGDCPSLGAARAGAGRRLRAAFGNRHPPGRSYRFVQREQRPPIRPGAERSNIGIPTRSERQVIRSGSAKVITAGRIGGAAGFLRRALRASMSTRAGSRTFRMGRSGPASPSPLFSIPPPSYKTGRTRPIGRVRTRALCTTVRAPEGVARHPPNKTPSVIRSVRQWPLVRSPTGRDLGPLLGALGVRRPAIPHPPEIVKCTRGDRA